MRQLSFFHFGGEDYSLPQGPAGDSAVFDPDTGNILATLESTTGQSTTTAMTQKAVTDELGKNANKVWSSLNISWNKNDKYYNENGGLTATSGYDNAVVDVSAYQGRNIVIYVYMGAVVCSIFKDTNGTKLTSKKSMTSGTWSTTVPANATTLCLSNSRSKNSAPYVRVHTSDKLAIEVANENAAAIASLTTTVEKVNISAPAVTYPAVFFTLRSGYYIANDTGIETANSNYKVYKNIPVSIVTNTITHNGANSNGFHCYDAGGNWLGLVSKGVSVANLPAGTTELRFSTTSSNLTITCTTTAKTALEGLINEKEEQQMIRVMTKVGNVSPDIRNPELNGAYAITDYIPLYGAAGVVYPGGADTNAICFYDSSLNYVGGTFGMSAKAPSEAVFFVARVGANTLAGTEVTLVLKGVAAPNYNGIIDIHRKVSRLTSHLKGKKIAFLGDSITDANFYGAWVRLLCEMLGTTAKNVAVAGKRYAVGEIAAQVDSLDGDEDVAIIFAGTNDYSRANAPGTAYAVVEGVRTATTGNSTAAGVHATIRGIYDKCGFIPIVIMTPLPRPGSSIESGSSWAANSNGFFLEDYVNVIIGVAQYYSIPVLDIFHTCNIPAPITPANTFFPNNETVHPLINVHGMIARRMYKFLMEVMDRW